MTATPQEIFLSSLPEIERILAYICRRHALRGAEAEDFASDARLRILEDDCAVLRKFKGQSQLATYLTVVIYRFLLDYQDARWGKWRASAEAKRRGELALRLEALLHRDGVPFEEAVLVMSDVPRRELEWLAERLPLRIRRRFEGEESLAARADPAPSAERRLVATEAAGEIRAAIAQLTEGRETLGSRDRALLRLRFDEGLSVAQIASLLGEEAGRLYRHYERLLSALRRRLEARGIHREALVAAFATLAEAPEEAEFVEPGTGGRE